MRYYTEVTRREHPELVGCEYVYSYTWEDTHPSDCFDDTCHDIDEMVTKIDSGRLDWFIAKVAVEYKGTELGTNYLGGNLYDSAEDAIREGLDGYIEDMEDSATDEAVKHVAEMQQIKLMKKEVDRLDQ